MQGRAYLRRRVQGDSGLGLVEVLVSLFVLAVALSTLLSGMLASALSVQTQTRRAGAVRVAMDVNDNYRARDYADVVSETRTVVRNGTTYTVVSTVTEGPADPGGGGPAAAVLKTVSTRASWTVKGSTRSVTMRTAVRPEAPAIAPPGATPTATPSPTPSPTSAQAIVSATVVPDPIIVSSTGVATQNLSISAVLAGFAASTPVTVRWVNDGGLTQTATLTSSDGTTWATTVSAASIVHATGLGTPGSLDLTVTVGSLTRVVTVTTQRQVTSPPAVVTATVTPSTIDRYTSGTQAGENKGPVDLQAEVSGLDTSSTIDSVKVTYTATGGVVKEIALVRQTNPLLWAYTFADKAEKFQAGAQSFTFTVRRASDGATGTRTAAVTVS